LFGSGLLRREAVYRRRHRLTDAAAPEDNRIQTLAQKFIEVGAVLATHADVPTWLRLGHSADIAVSARRSDAKAAGRTAASSSNAKSTVTLMPGTGCWSLYRRSFWLLKHFGTFGLGLSRKEAESLRFGGAFAYRHSR
jgi:hypothetical protein